MPEGPSIVILKEEASVFKGKKVIDVNGNSKIDLSIIRNKAIIDFKTWGKQFLICFKDFTIRIHLLLFGSYRINAKKEIAPRLSLKFKNGELNFYSCSVKIIQGNLDTIYDWEIDVMSPHWNPKKVISKIKKLNAAPVCDLLLDQNIFAGSGNIIKNEVLYRIYMHPLSNYSILPTKKLKELVLETRNYCFDFYKWKKKFEFKKHWLAYRQKICKRCNLPIIFKKLGKHNRYTYFCKNCQKLYA